MRQFIEYVEQFHGNNPQEIQFVNEILVPYSKENKVDTTEVEHILDFLFANKVKDVSKISYRHFVDKAAKWQKKLESVKVKDDSDGIETVLDFGDGFRFVKLVSKESYEKEGKLMSHCVASYYGNSSVIYSLRDASNNPHCTIEEDNQIKGKGNGTIHPKYVGYVVKFLEHLGMEVRESEMLNLGYRSVEGIHEYLDEKSKSRIYDGKWIPSDDEIAFKDGKDMWDIIKDKDLVTETETSVRANFTAPFFRFGIELFHKKTVKEATTGNYAHSAATGNYAHSATTGESAHSATTGYNAHSATTGNYAHSATTGESAHSATTGYYAHSATTGENAHSATTGNYAHSATTGNYAHSATTGYYAHSATTGENAHSATTGESARSATTGYNARSATTGENAHSATTGNYAHSATTGENAHSATTGNYAHSATTGYNAHSATTGESAHSATTGYNAHSATTGENAHSATTGYNAHSATTGNYAHSAATGYNAHSATTGENARSATNGKNSIAVALGFQGKAKSSIGNWIVLSEIKWNGSEYEVLEVKTAKVDGKEIKEDTYYELVGGKFVESK